MEQFVQRLFPLLAGPAFWDSQLASDPGYGVSQAGTMSRVEHDWARHAVFLQQFLLNVPVQGWFSLGPELGQSGSDVS